MRSSHVELSLATPTSSHTPTNVYSTAVAIHSDALTSADREQLGNGALSENARELLRVVDQDSLLESVDKVVKKQFVEPLFGDDLACFGNLRVLLTDSGRPELHCLDCDGGTVLTIDKCLLRHDGDACFDPSLLAAMIAWKLQRKLNESRDLPHPSSEHLASQVGRRMIVGDFNPLVLHRLSSGDVEFQQAVDAALIQLETDFGYLTPDVHRSGESELTQLARDAQHKSKVSNLLHRMAETLHEPLNSVDTLSSALDLQIEALANEGELNQAQLSETRQLILDLVQAVRTSPAFQAERKLAIREQLEPKMREDVRELFSEPLLGPDGRPIEEMDDSFAPLSSDAEDEEVQKSIDAYLENPKNFERILGWHERMLNSQLSSVLLGEPGTFVDRIVEASENAPKSACDLYRTICQALDRENQRIVPLGQLAKTVVIDGAQNFAHSFDVADATIDAVEFMESLEELPLMRSREGRELMREIDWNSVFSKGSNDMRKVKLDLHIAVALGQAEKTKGVELEPEERLDVAKALLTMGYWNPALLQVDPDLALAYLEGRMAAEELAQGKHRDDLGSDGGFVRLRIDWKHVRVVENPAGGREADRASDKKTASAIFDIDSADGTRADPIKIMKALAREKKDEKVEEVAQDKFTLVSQLEGIEAIQDKLFQQSPSDHRTQYLERTVELLERYRHRFYSNDKRGENLHGDWTSMRGERFIGLDRWQEDVGTFVCTNREVIRFPGWGQDQLIEDFEHRLESSDDKPLVQQQIRELLDQVVDGLFFPEYLQSEGIRSCKLLHYALEAPGLYGPHEKLELLKRAGVFHALLESSMDYDRETGWSVNDDGTFGTYLALEESLRAYFRAAHSDYFADSGPVSFSDLTHAIRSPEFRALPGSAHMAILEGIHLMSGHNGEAALASASELEGILDFAMADSSFTTTEKVKQLVRLMHDTSQTVELDPNVDSLSAVRSWRFLSVFELVPPARTDAMLRQIYSGLQGSSRHVENQEALEQILFGEVASGSVPVSNTSDLSPRIASVDFKNELRNAWAKTVRAALEEETGKEIDDGSSEYQTAVMRAASRMRVGAPMTEHEAYLEALATSTVSQGALTKVLLSSVPVVDKRSLAKGFVLDVFGDTLGKKLLLDPTSRRRLLQLVAYPPRESSFLWFAQGVSLDLGISHNTGDVERLKQGASLFGESFRATRPDLQARIVKLLMYGEEGPSEDTDIREHMNEVLNALFMEIPMKGPGAAVRRLLERSVENVLLTRSEVNGGVSDALARLLASMRRDDDGKGRIIVGSTLLNFARELDPLTFKTLQELATEIDLMREAEGEHIAVLADELNNAKSKARNPGRLQWAPTFFELLESDTSERSYVTHVGHPIADASSFLSVDTETQGGKGSIGKLVLTHANRKIQGGYRAMVRALDRYERVYGESEFTLLTRARLEEIRRRSLAEVDPAQWAEQAEIHRKHFNAGVTIDGRKQHFRSVALEKVIEGEDTAYRREQRGPGVHFGEVVDEPLGSEVRKDRAMGTVALVVSQVVSGERFEVNLHEKNQLNAVSENIPVTTVVDWGGVTPLEPSMDDLEDIGVLFNTLLGVSDLKGTLSRHLASSVGGLAEKRGELSPAITEVYSTLMALQDFSRELSHQELRRAVVAGLAEAHPRVRESLTAHSLSEAGDFHIQKTTAASA